MMISTNVGVWYWQSLADIWDYSFSSSLHFLFDVKLRWTSDQRINY